MNNDTGIYAIVSPSGKQYIGSAVSFKKRWREHRRQLRGGFHHSKSLQRAWGKYGEGAFEFRKIVLCPITDLLAIEQLKIDSLKPEYNILPNAGSRLGHKSGPQSPESRGKKSIAMMGRPKSEASKLKMSITRKGIVYSEETRRRISESKTGKKLTPEQLASRIGRKHSEAHKAAIGRASLGRRHSEASILKMREVQNGRIPPPHVKAAQIAAVSRPVVCVETGEKFSSGSAAVLWLIDQGKSKAQSTPISHVCMGKRASAYGFRWQYA